MAAPPGGELPRSLRSGAIGCAIGIQRTLAEHRRSHGSAPAIRMGLHASDTSRTAGKYTGKGVHVAARIAALADGGEILASSSTIEGLEDVRASEPQQVALKGISAEVPIVSIDWS